ncbi:DUF2812 domain-containing protein [Brevibacillus sp. TJ4]|uniref:DUF2812 domain-containing protein n=1 Tax=Brevibacillus sp. TJ4 TaxID=3234853 RepID=UPI0037D5AA5A
MKTYKFFTDFEKEEKWLNDMARKGYRFQRKTMLGYVFEAAEPEDATIKIDYRTFKKQEDFEDYRALFEDSGWEHLSGTKSSGYQYFKKMNDQGSDDIFSDVDSKAGRYKRLSEMWVSLAAAFLPIVVALIATDTFDIAVLRDPKLLYLTPGLWELDGAAFWRALLFETPFALFRGLPLLILPLTVASYLYFAVHANLQYKHSKQ